MSFLEKIHLMQNVFTLQDSHSEKRCSNEHFLALPFLDIGMKTDFSSPVATAGFSKYADILSAAL